jgi:hypothetical protein
MLYCSKDTSCHNRNLHRSYTLHEEIRVPRSVYNSPKNNKPSISACTLTGDTQKHIFAKRKQLRITLAKMYWLLVHKSKLSTSNKPIYETILKSILDYGIQLWCKASTFNIEILKRFQSKAPRLVCARIRLFEGKSKHQLKKKSAVTALNTALASAHAPRTL